MIFRVRDRVYGVRSDASAEEYTVVLGFALLEGCSVEWIR